MSSGRRVAIGAAATLAIAIAAPTFHASANTPATFSTATNWVWAFSSTQDTGSANESASATIKGNTTADRNGALVFRQSDNSNYVLVIVSGTRYQVMIVHGGAVNNAIDRAFNASGGGTLHATLSGTTITTQWNGATIATDNIAALSAMGGTHAGVAVWQNVSNAVDITNISVGSGSGSTPKVATATAAPAAPSAAPAPAPPAATGAWKSGASGDNVTNGSFGAWRGRSVDIAGTWCDTYDASTSLWCVSSGGPYGSWQKDLDIATGGLYKNRGDSWSAAAAGAYDSRWTSTLTKLKNDWGSRPGTLYIRPFHEFNGDWEQWSVKGYETGDFINAWKRYRALQKQILPNAKLVMSVSSETSGSLGLDWRKAFPGAGYVDVMSVDYYNQWPYVNTASDFTNATMATDGMGAPKGIEKHREFAQSVGLPFAISEWSSNSSMGDAPGFMDAFHSWVAAHAGTGSGKLIYEVFFDVTNYDNNKFGIYPSTSMPQAAQRYAADW